MNIAIIVAAGSGNRFGGVMPKQFVEIFGKPLLIHTLEKFENCPAINEIVLVLSAIEIENFQKVLVKHSFGKLSKIVAGGANRAESVRRGFGAIDDAEVEIVAVHDGARPLVTIEEITQTVEKAFETGAACLAVAVTDTIKKVADGKIVETVDRANLCRALTPQCFRYEILKRAFDENTVSEAVTDECSLVEKSGYPIAVVEGSAKNIKITMPEDFIFAENLLKQSQTENV